MAVATDGTVAGEDTGKNVYLIEHEHGFIKIGVSQNPKQRVRDLQTSCPYDLSVLAVIETDVPFTVESHLHEKYENRKQQGEWFDLSTREKIHLLNLADLDRQQVDRRYYVSTEERKHRTRMLQGLVG